MKRLSAMLGIILVLIGITAVSAAGNTITATSAQDAAALVYVSGYEITPEVFYPYETGTVTVHVTNGANASVVVATPDLIDPNVHVVNTNVFNTRTTIGPGATADFSFVITVDPPDGTYFPLFTISPQVYGNSIHSTLTLKVDSDDVQASISKEPDTFSLSKKDTVNVSIVNPREGEISRVWVRASGSNADISPEEKYVGTIPAGGSVEVPFQITPYQQTDAVFNITYENGDNKHSTSLVLPLDIGTDKTKAEIVVNNLESTSSGMTRTLKGDITNNGLIDAKSVLVTVGSPATAVNPNPVYAIGNLEPDDFSSFEVTYTTKDNGAVPLIVDYKDEDGNSFSEKFSITAEDNSALPGSAAGNSASAGASGQRRGMFGSFGSGVSQIPVTEIVIGLIAIIVLIVAWRKGLLRRLANRFRKDPLPEDDDSEQQE